MITDIKFDDRGLIPAIVQDARTRDVLTLAYMNAESLSLTIQTGETWFFSRSRQELWHKGATSGNTQRVVDIALDCDGDALIVRVEPAGPACHTGANTCFHNEIPVDPRPTDDSRSPKADPGRVVPPRLGLVNIGAMEFGIVLDTLYALIADRKRERPEGSYTTYLFNSGLDKILKKVGEEATETVIAAKNGSHPEMVAELSDLFYHLLVLMVDRDVALADIQLELEKRAGKTREPLPKTENRK